MIDAVKELYAYRQFIQKNNYIHTLQKLGLDLLASFFNQSKETCFEMKALQESLEYFLCIWLPRNKKYLTDIEAFNIVYTLQDFEVYLEKKYAVPLDVPCVLEGYRKDYMRVYKAKHFLDKMVGDPVLSTSPLLIDLDNYRQRKQKEARKESMCLYEQGVFRIDEVNEEGYIGLAKLGAKKYCKVLCRPNMLYHFKQNDLLHITLKKKVFFVYWEIESIKVYYPQQAMRYL